jgi:signal transduction histidine kinase
MKTQQLAEFKALLNELEKENEELALALHDDILQQLLAVKLYYGMINGNIEHLVPKEIQIAFDKQNNELSEVLDLMK